MYIRHKRKLLSQNFLHNREFVNQLVRSSSIGKNDIVIEIGPGKGIITEALARQAKHVFAVEIDTGLANKLRRRFGKYNNVTIINSDFHQFSLPSYPYKVFANIPFNITADIIYKLLYYSHPPEDTYLIVQKEAAEKFSGIPHETQFSILTKPWFDFSIQWRFNRHDFIPMPSVDSILLRITKRQIPILSNDQEDLYKSFVRYGFNTWKKDLKVGLKQVFTYTQWKRLAQENSFSIHVKPTDLTFEQWIAISLFFIKINMQG